MPIIVSVHGKHLKTNADNTNSPRHGDDDWHRLGIDRPAQEGSGIEAQLS